MRRFLNERHSNYNELGDKVDSHCEDCEKKWYPFSRLWWDDNDKNIVDIKRRDNGVLVIKKILSLLNSITISIKDLYSKIDVIEPTTISESDVILERNYEVLNITIDDKQSDLNIALYENYIKLESNKLDKPLVNNTSDYVILGDGSTELKTNFGKVSSVNGQDGDVVLKTSDLENDSNFTTKDYVDGRIDNKIDKPTSSGSIIDFPFVVGINNEGVSTRISSSSLGSNFANTNLNVTENRVHGGTASVEMQMPFIFSNPNIKLTGIQDKSSDATYVQTLVRDLNGNENYITNPYQLHKYQWSLLTSLEKRELLRIISDNASDTSLMSVNTISPYIIQNRFDSVEYVIIRGSNLRMGEVGSIEIIDRDTNEVIVNIPRNKITSESSIELIFEYNFYNFPVGNYVLNIKRGLDEYTTSQEMRIVDMIEDIDLNSIEWEFLYAPGVTASAQDTAQGGRFSIEVHNGITSTPAKSLKSSELFTQGEDFYIEMKIELGYAYGGRNYNLSTIGIGYSNTVNSLINSSLVNMGFNHAWENVAYIYNTSIGVITAGARLPRTFTLIIVKTGNLLRTTVENNTLITTISNNSGYSLFAQILGYENDTTPQVIQGLVTKAFKIN